MTDPTDRSVDPSLVGPSQRGPMLVRGRWLVADSAGVLHPTKRPVSAVCRCGRSAIQPWCDGSHKLRPKGRPNTDGPVPSPCDARG
ncbi:CDGSH iron-sulfur domain-containing protein [Nocardioides limicola]|uniref:CDGSH iron-sulfur domain-containing protein n=1 Tax=Nocardioides limicola TaxID=2803368 RepID=UPI00193B1540|nr:CDGSH iron-sulfur domain-containing protein [Nocardioides sp. DJM-14]